MENEGKVFNNHIIFKKILAKDDTRNIIIEVCFFYEF